MQFSDTIVAKKRDAGSKGVARKLRAAGMIPAVLYGPSSEASYLALEPKDFVGQRLQYGRAHMYNLQGEGTEPCKVFIKEIQRDPIAGTVLHVDLYKVDANRPIRMSVRIELTGKPVGVVAGGLLSQSLHRIEVRGLPHLIPESVTVDVSALEIGDSLHVDAITLPEGVKLTGHGDESVASVNEADTSSDVVATPGAAAPGAPAVAGAAAKGAAGAKAPAAAAGAKAPAAAAGKAAPKAPAKK